MHDLALPSSGDASGTGDACLFGLSLCSGAGGLDLGLTIAMSPLGDASIACRAAGYRTVGQVERETYAAATLVARMEEAALDCAPVWDDVGTFDGRPWRGAVDIVTAGYPCQPISVAGTFETVNTLGLPLYARTIPDRDRDEWVRLEIESNPLPICTRPQVLRSARRT